MAGHEIRTHMPMETARSQESPSVIADASLRHFPRRAVLLQRWDLGALGALGVCWELPWGSVKRTAGNPKDGASSNAGLLANLANSASGNALGAQAGLRERLKCY